MKHDSPDDSLSIVNIVVVLRPSSATAFRGLDQGQRSLGHGGNARQPRLGQDIGHRTYRASFRVCRTVQVLYGDPANEYRHRIAQSDSAFELTSASALLARQPYKIARIIAKLERSAHCAISPEERRVRCRKLEMQGGGSVVANHAPEHANTMIMIRAAIHSLLLWMGVHQA